MRTMECEIIDRMNGAGLMAYYMFEMRCDGVPKQCERRVRVEWWSWRQYGGVVGAGDIGRSTFL